MVLQLAHSGWAWSSTFLIELREQNLHGTEYLLMTGLLAPRVIGISIIRTVREIISLVISPVVSSYYPRALM